MANRFMLRVKYRGSTYILRTARCNYKNNNKGKQCEIILSHKYDNSS